MSPGQMLPGQMSPWQLEFFLEVPRNLLLKLHQNLVGNGWDFVDIEFVWGGGGGGKSVTINRPVNSNYKTVIKFKTDILVK